MGSCRGLAALFSGFLVLAAVDVAQAGPIEDCAAELPGGQPPLYARMPASHTELCRRGYVTSHDNIAHGPRWTGWRLDPARAVSCLKRTDDFRTDPDLPPGAGATPDDYEHTGFDRGHQMPAEDAWPDMAAVHESFSMANMSPQTPGLNRGPWKAIEQWSRQLAATPGAGMVYVFDGPVLPPTPVTIGPSQVAVPAAFWKVVLVGGGAVAFMLPNIGQFTPGPIGQFAMPVTAVEIAAGLMFPLPAGFDRTRAVVLPTVNAAVWRQGHATACAMPQPPG